MKWYFILFILIAVVIFISVIYWYFSKINDALYSKAIRVEESVCVVKKGHTHGRKRITYRCDDPNGCMYKGQLHKGTFYDVEECIDDRLQKGWIYSPCGPFYGASEFLPGDFSIKTSELKMLEPVSLRVCLSTETGHPKEFQDGKLGFSGIACVSKHKIKLPEIKISTKYENSQIMLDKISKLLNDKQSEIILIDNQPYVLQPCTLKGNLSFVYFKLTFDKKYLIIKENQVFLTEYNDELSDVYFALENLRKIDNKKTGVLVCYKGFHEKGWLDKKLKWHAGLSKVGSLNVSIDNNKIYGFDNLPFQIPSADGEINSDLFNVEIISNPLDFISNRIEKLTYSNLN